MPVTRYRDVGEIPEPARSGSALEGLAAAKLPPRFTGLLAGVGHDAGQRTPAAAVT